MKVIDLFCGASGSAITCEGGCGGDWSRMRDMMDGSTNMRRRFVLDDNELITRILHQAADIVMGDLTQTPGYVTTVELVIGPLFVEAIFRNPKINCKRASIL